MNIKGIVTWLLLTAWVAHAQETLPTDSLIINKNWISVSQQLVSLWFAQIEDTVSVSNLIQYLIALQKQYCKESYSQKWNKCLVTIYRANNQFQILYMADSSSSSEELVITYISNSGRDVDKAHFIRCEEWWVTEYYWSRRIYEDKSQRIWSIYEYAPKEYGLLLQSNENIGHHAGHLLKVLNGMPKNTIEDKGWKNKKRRR